MKLYILAAVVLLHTTAFAQTTYTGTSVDLVISGTSTLHNWDMKSAKANCTAAFVVNTAGQVTSLSTVHFSTPAASLKSDHNAMDKNAYKALKTDKNPAITYTSAATSPAETGTGIIKVRGQLTIAGTTRDEELIAVCKTNADNTITVTGSKNISMKDFNMTPPTFMLGTVKTGNDIVLKFTMILKKS